MSGFKGTPGPWEVMKDDDELRVIQSGSLEGGFGWKSYCSVCEGVSSEDNSKLIAAAPEILEALQDLVFLYEHDEGCRELTEYKRAKKAIKKALGVSDE